MPKVLIIEDDPTIRTAVMRALTDKGYAVAAAHTAMSGLQLAMSEYPDVVVLDLGLPDLDGREVIRMLRAVSEVPVIVATARESEAEIVRSLDAGADDYLVKPFGAAQLDARIRAVLRRAAEPPAEAVIEVGGLRVDRRARQASLDGAELDLTPREFDLLHYLAVRAGTVVTKQELLVEVWQQPYGGADKSVDVHLSWLRRKLGETAQKPRYLHTVRRVGVRLAAPDGPGAPGAPQAPGGPEEDTSGGFKYGGWTASYGDELFGKLMQEEMKQADYLLGRKTFEIFESYWPQHADFWPGINDGNKYVLSQTREESDWANTTFLKSVADIESVKNSEGADIQVWGSSELIHLLLKNGLVDELRLKIYPVVLGKGKKLFDDGVPAAAFTLTESHVTSKGIIIASYKKTGEVTTGNVEI